MEQLIAERNLEMADTQITKDPTMDLRKIMEDVNTTEQPEVISPSPEAASVMQFTEVEKNLQKPEEPQKDSLTPAEQLIENRQTKGMIVTDQELRDGEKKPLKNPIDGDERRLEGYADAESEYDRAIRARTMLRQKRVVKDEIDHTNMMDELTSLNPDELANLQKKMPNGAPLKLKFFDLAPINVNEQLINVDTGSYDQDIPTKETEGESKSEKDTEVPDNPLIDKETIEKNKQVALKSEEEHGQLVKVIIDKTNLGMPAVFDEVERNIILNATQIDLVEVETVDLSTVNIKKPPKSFVEAIHTYESSGLQVAMVFPCSRFRATLGGLTYGEMADIALSIDNSTYDSERKKLSIIYNKMKNISTGQFHSFDEFLDGFAYADVDLATYALYIASTAEHDRMTLRCGKDDCLRSFNVPFRSRSLLDLDACSEVFLKMTRDVAEANGEAAKELRASSPILNQKIVKLPNSEWLVKIGMMSCRDYLDGIVKNGSVDEFRKTHENDVNNVSYQNIVFLQTVRAICIPDGQGGYWEYDAYEDILEALYIMNPADFQILGTMLNKYVEDYTVQFSVKNVTCPHCKTISDVVPINIDTMVFRAYQRRVNTTVNLEKLQDL